MPYFAMLVVVEHDDAEKATVALHTGEGMMNRIRFLSEPWEAQDPENPPENPHARGEADR